MKQYGNNYTFQTKFKVTSYKTKTEYVHVEFCKRKKRFKIEAHLSKMDKYSNLLLF